MTPGEFYQKCDYEGGLLEAVFGYGLTADDLDDSDPGLKQAIRELAAIAPLVDRAKDLLYAHEDDWVSYDDL